MSLEVRLVLAALALFRLGELFTLDDGMADMFFRLRVRVGVYDRDESGRVRTSLGRLFECPYCLSMWLAVPVLALALIPTQIGDLFLLWLALAGMQAFLQTVGGRK